MLFNYQNFLFGSATMPYIAEGYNIQLEFFWQCNTGPETLQSPPLKCFSTNVFRNVFSTLLFGNNYMLHERHPPFFSICFFYSFFIYHLPLWCEFQAHFQQPIVVFLDRAPHALGWWISFAFALIQVFSYFYITNGKIRTKKKGKRKNKHVVAHIQKKWRENGVQK